MMSLLEEIRQKALRGEGATADEAVGLSTEASIDAICDVADEVRRHWHGDHFHTCSIVNARSGRCTEDCKWCSQAAGHCTGVEQYDFVDEKELRALVERNNCRGVERFSMVTSGRKVSVNDIRRFCQMYADCKRHSDMELCASMGLLSKEQLQALYDAGVRRYHCNLETSASKFPELCTSHTRDDKLRTIRWAREVGMEVCSGGIIGMGETLRQRMEMVEEAREAGAVSIPLNILNPIPGTPLASTPLIAEHEVVLTAALARLVAPKAVLRFAGGRARISEEATRRMLRGGVNGAIVGDMLTTVGNKMDPDFALFESEGYDVTKPAKKI